MSDHALAPITLADQIPTIAEVIADRIKGNAVMVTHPTRGHEVYHFAATPECDEDGPYIALIISEYGTLPESIKVNIHISEPITQKRSET